MKAMFQVTEFVNAVCFGGSVYLLWIGFHVSLDILVWNIEFGVWWDV